MEVRRKKGHKTMVQMISICADSPEELAAKLKELESDGEGLLGLERKPCENSGNESREPNAGWDSESREPDAGRACCSGRPDGESVLLTVRRDLVKARRRILKGEGRDVALCALDCTIDQLDSLLAEM